MAPLTLEHLARLSAVAHDDHELFFQRQPRGRALAVVLAQGGAQHLVYGRAGVKDLDVWTFFSLPPGMTTFPAPVRNRNVDFGPSELGRQRYDLAAAKNEAERRRIRKWSSFQGRRVDLLMRGLPVPLDADPAEAIRAWLRPTSRPPRTSPEYLARKPIVIIDPEPRRGETSGPPSWLGPSPSGASESVNWAARRLGHPDTIRPSDRVEGVRA